MSLTTIDNYHRPSPYFLPTFSLLPLYFLPTSSHKPITLLADFLPTAFQLHFLSHCRRHCPTSSLSPSDIHPTAIQCHQYAFRLPSYCLPTAFPLQAHCIAAAYVQPSDCIPTTLLLISSCRFPTACRWPSFSFPTTYHHRPTTTTLIFHMHTYIT